MGGAEPRLALELTPQGVSLLERSADAVSEVLPEGDTAGDAARAGWRRTGRFPWRVLETVPLQVGRLKPALGALREMAAARGSTHVRVFLPSAEILAATPRIAHHRGAARRTAVERALTAAGGAGPLLFAEGPASEDGRLPIAGLPVEIAEEARRFLDGFGFAAADFSLRETPDGFVVPPVFAMEQRALPRLWPWAAAAGVAATFGLGAALWAGLGGVVGTGEPTPQIEVSVVAPLGGAGVGPNGVGASVPLPGPLPRPLLGVAGPAGSLVAPSRRGAALPPTASAEAGPVAVRVSVAPAAPRVGLGAQAPTFEAGVGALGRPRGLGTPDPTAPLPLGFEGPAFPELASAGSHSRFARGRPPEPVRRTEVNGLGSAGPDLAGFLEPSGPGRPPRAAQVATLAQPERQSQAPVPPGSAQTVSTRGRGAQPLGGYRFGGSAPVAMAELALGGGELALLRAEARPRLPDGVAQRAAGAAAAAMRLAAAPGAAGDLPTVDAAPGPSALVRVPGGVSGPNVAADAPRAPGAKTSLRRAALIARVSAPVVRQSLPNRDGYQVAVRETAPDVTPPGTRPRLVRPAVPLGVVVLPDAPLQGPPLPASVVVAQPDLQPPRRLATGLVRAQAPDLQPPERAPDQRVPEAVVVSQGAVPDGALGAEPEVLRPDGGFLPGLGPDATPLRVAVLRIGPDLAPPTRPLADPEEDLTPSALARSIGPEASPPRRPVALVEAVEEDEDLTPTALALATSARPGARPRDLSARVAREVAAAAAVAVARRTNARAAARAEAQAEARTGAASEPAPSAAPAPPRQTARAPAAAAPVLPSSASVARAATVQNALPLRRLVLIGVFGASGNREALMRTSRGRIVKVKTGDRIGGYDVAAIGSDAIRLRRRGQDLVLGIPD